MNSEEKREAYFVSNPDVFSAYKEILRINDTLDYKFTDRKFREIKQYAIENTAFYKNYSIDDTFPVMTKMDYINNYDAIRSTEVFSEPLHITSTSGSTGIPFKVEQNKEKRNRTIADLKAFGTYALFESHDKMIQLRSYCGKKLDRTIDEKENIWRYDIFDLQSGGGIDSFIEFVLEYKPVVIFSYVSALETICEYILSSGKSYDFNVKSILVGAEALTKEVYEKFYKVFKCPVFDRYSDMEMGILAQREFGKLFRINKASYYFECLKLDKDEPTKEGELGRLVFTDLFNHAFPMIRYDTGDLGTYKTIDGEIYIETVYGRSLDQIYNEKMEIINPHDLSRSMSGITGIVQWQLIQKSINCFVLRCIAKSTFQQFEAIDRLRKILGTGVKINVELVDDIPVLNSQKRKAIINEMIVKQYK